jgi:hypothetical protein
MNYTDIFLSALLPYTKQHNTGNVYEIAVALKLMRQMGMPDYILDEQSDVINKICAENVKNELKIRGLFMDIRKEPVGTGLVFDGFKVLNVESVTQSDDVGGTGDLILHTTTGTKSLSIFNGTVTKKDNKINKCLSNPTCKRFGCTDEDVEKFKKIGLAAVPLFKEFMCKQYGADESKWVSQKGKPNPIAIKPCSEVATLIATKFASLSADDKKAVFEDIMRIEEGKKPADYIAVVNKTCKNIQYFQFGEVLVNGNVVRTLEADGISLCFKVNGKIVGKTQVKYNNGVYYKGKTSSIVSSYDSVFCLNDLFTMKPVQAVSSPHI